MRARPQQLVKSRQPAGAPPTAMRASSRRRALEFGRVGGVGDHETRAAARKPIGDVGAGELRRRGDDDQPELHRRQHRNPERRDIAEHQQQPVAALGAERSQAVGDAMKLPPARRRCGFPASSPRMMSAGRSPLSPAASSSSNQSSAQLKRSSSARRNSLGGRVVGPQREEKVAGVFEVLVRHRQVTRPGAADQAGKARQVGFPARRGDLPQRPRHRKGFRQFGDALSPLPARPRSTATPAFSWARKGSRRPSAAKAGSARRTDRRSRAGR